MDTNKIAGELLKVAKNMTAGFGVGDVLGAVDKFTKRNALYLVVLADVHGVGRIEVSGNVHRMATWLEETSSIGRLNSWKITDVTSDRNEARKKASEI